MDWTAVGLSLRLALLTVLILVPAGLLVARWLAWTPFRTRPLVEALFALPLVLPPTVLGFYLLVAMGGHSPLGRWFEQVAGQTLAFSFWGILVASLIANLPFAIQPMQRAFEAIAPEVREAAAVSGLSRWRSFWRIELPLAWPGVLSATVLTFAHTLGEFGVVLMVGGSIPGETRTAAIAIYDRVQAFDEAGAGRMAALLLAISMVAISASYLVSARMGQRRG
jgi:molybdate transport system permease protein